VRCSHKKLQLAYIPSFTLAACGGEK